MSIDEVAILVEYEIFAIAEHRNTCMVMLGNVEDVSLQYIWVSSRGE